MLFDHLTEDVDPTTDFLKLKRTIYGTVQAPRQWFKYFIWELQDKISFRQARADPCLLVNHTKEGAVIVCIYVDDTGLFGLRKSVFQAKEAIARLFKVNDVGPLQEYVSVTIERPNHRELLLSQPDRVRNLEIGNRKMEDGTRKVELGIE